MIAWSLPTSVQVGTRSFNINSDFRDILEIIDVLGDQEKHERMRMIVALSLFYEGFEEISPLDYQEALERMLEFVACGEEDDGMAQPKVIDWNQDRMIIAAEINKVAGTEIRALEYLHWWTFISYFNGIGEGQLSFVVSIREKLRKGKKLEKHEREFYRKNRARVDFKQHFTQAEETEMSKWLT